MSVNEQVYESRRPVILSRNGAVACADHNAARMGQNVLRMGGNAADAAVAVAAGLNLCNPMSTGLGGDAFCLFYDASQKEVKGLNGSGHSPAALTLQLVNDAGYDQDNPFPQNHGFSVTVPGAAATWIDTVEMYGSGNLTLGQILEPAVDLAENGYPVAQTAAHFWDRGSWLLQDPRNIHGGDLLIDGRSPKWGEMFLNPNLAQTFRTLATEGKKGFYEGHIAEAIVEAVARFDGVMTLEDLREHTTAVVEPISTSYKGVRLWEIPPNGQGIVALMALNILEPFDLKDMGHNSTQYLHTLIESLRLGFADALTYVADPDVVPVPIEAMLSKEYAAERRALIDPDKAMDEVPPGDLDMMGKDTVYITVIDGQGNACSFINSNYQGFGTGIVPEGCGITLQNRGKNFSLVPGHRNVLAPKKRPFHTIIPAMLTKDETGELLASYGVMGGYMQPQGHVQVLLNMLEFNMNPQTALDKPRFCIGPGHESPLGSVSMEEGISEAVMDGLRAKGHNVTGPVTGYNRSLFGRGHVSTKGAWWLPEGTTDAVNDPTVLWTGTDPRADGQALGY